MRLNCLFKKCIAILLCSYLPCGSVCGETFGSSWPTDSALFHIGNLNGADDVWIDAFEEGAKRWNDVPTSFQFLTERTSGTGFCTSTGNNSVQFSSTFCGDAWGSTILGVTRYWFRGATMLKADIVFNKKLDWSVYDGARQSFSYDFRRVAVHEMGHGAGLDHPRATDVIMSAFLNDAYLPALDDINSLQGIYGETTHTLTLKNSGDGVISVTPKVPGTGVVSDNVLHTSNYGSFLDCNVPVCRIPIQDGLRLIIEARPNTSNGVEFDSWSGTTVLSDSVVLNPMVDDRTITAHYSIGFDEDDDGVADHADNCPNVVNADQKNTDDDSVGDACDAFPNDPAETLDSDSDSVGDNADNCPNVANADQTNTDDDKLGNLCDLDDDNDGVLDAVDALPLNADESVDTDGDGVGNNADTDDDNDGTQDEIDYFPLDASESVDTDGDGVGNNADTDDDNDGVLDGVDAFPLEVSESIDTDGDSIGNNADIDDDGDSVLDQDDAFPLDSTKSVAASGDANVSNSGGGAISLLDLILISLLGFVRRMV